MTTLFDATAGRIVIRRPDDSILLDTDTRMPFVLGSISLTGMTVDWPITDGEYNEYLPLNGLWRHRMYQTQHNTQQVLAAYPSPVLPQFFWCRVKLTSTAQGVIAGIPLARRFTAGQWMPLIGSLFLETFGSYLIRHMNIAVTGVGGNIVLEKRQSTTFKLSDYDQQSTTRSTFTMDLELAWGAYDL